jgi:hypothetical protein
MMLMICSGIFLFFKILEERGIKYDPLEDGEPDSWLKKIKWIFKQVYYSIFGKKEEPVKLDEIDQDFIDALDKLPDKGFFIKEG